MVSKRRSGKLPAAVELGRRGGLKGGPARARALSEAQQRMIARLGGKAHARKQQ